MRRTLISLFALLTLVSSSTFADGADAEELAAVLADQPEEVKARYEYRHPQQTLGFFGIAPGMTVVEALPGGGWYTKILLPYLGPEGRLIGVDYAQDMWPLFGFFGEDWLKKKKPGQRILRLKPAGGAATTGRRSALLHLARCLTA